MQPCNRIQNNNLQYFNFYLFIFYTFIPNSKQILNNTLFGFFLVHLATIINEFLNNIAFLARNMSLAQKLPCWLGACCWGKDGLLLTRISVWRWENVDTLCFRKQSVSKNSEIPGFHFPSTIPCFWRIVFLSAKVLVRQGSDSLPNVGELSRKVYPLPSDLEYEWRQGDMNHMLS